MDINVILNQLVTLFLIIGLGYFLQKIKLMNPEFNKRLIKILLNVTLPAMIINAILTMDERPALSNVLTAMGVSAGMYIILPLVGFIIAFILRIDKKSRGLYVFMTTFLNTGFMGFPLINAIFGNNAMLYAAIVNVFFNISCYSYGILLVTSGNSESEGKLSLKSILNTGLISSVIALILYFANLSYPACVVTAFTYVGNTTTPLAMLIIGTTLANMSFKEVFNDWKIYIFTFIKQIILPIASFPLLKILISDDLLLKVIFILICVPIANSAVLFATEYHADEKLAAKSVFISTLFSLLTIPVVIMACFR